GVGRTGRLARLSQTRTVLSHAVGSRGVVDSLCGIDERSAGTQRPSPKILIALRWSAVTSGASITVGRRPRSFVRTCTSVAFTSESDFIVAPVVVVRTQNLPAQARAFQQASTCRIDMPGERYAPPTLLHLCHHEV